MAAALLAGGVLMVTGIGCTDADIPRSSSSGSALEDSRSVEHAVEASTLPTEADLAEVPRLDVSGVQVSPFLVMSSRTAAPVQPPDELTWPVAASTDTVALTTVFTPLTAFFAGSAEVNADGIPDVEEQAFAECERDADGRCTFGAVDGRVIMLIPDEIDRTGPVHLVVQVEWDVVDSESPGVFHSLLASYAVLLQP